MGFDQSHVMSVLTKEGVNENSVIYLLTPEKIEERQENSIKQLRTFLDEASPSSEIQIVELAKNFRENLLRISELLNDLENSVVSLSGGARDFLTPLVLASSFNQRSIQKIYLNSDLDNSLEIIEIPSFRPQINQQEKEILNYLIGNEESNIGEISKGLEISSSTASRKVSEMEKKDLLNTERKSKGKVVEPSIKALMCLRR